MIPITGRVRLSRRTQNYATFLTDILEGDDQVGVCVDVEAIIATFDGLPEEELASIINALQDRDPISKSIASFLKNIPGEEMGSIKQFRSIKHPA